MNISYLTTTLIGEKEKTLPLIHKTDVKDIDDDKIVECEFIISNGTDSVSVEFFYETDDYKARLETESRQFALQIMKIEPYNSRIIALGEQAKIINIRVSPINIVSIN